MKIMACQVGPFHFKLTQINLTMNYIAKHKRIDEGLKLDTRGRIKSLNATSHVSRASTRHVRLNKLG